MNITIDVITVCLFVWMCLFWSARRLVTRADARADGYKQIAEDYKAALDRVLASPSKA